MKHPHNLFARWASSGAFRVHVGPKRKRDEISWRVVIPGMPRAQRLRSHACGARIFGRSHTPNDLRQSRHGT